MDAATVYANLLRDMNSTPTKRRQWQMVSIVCLAEPNIDGGYLSEADYGMLYRLAPAIQHAMESVDQVVLDVRKFVKDRIEAEKRRNNPQ
jgi:hypothetical protein